MWDLTAQNAVHLSHDRPCLDCGHAEHTYLPCDAECGCERSPVPGYYPESELAVA
ncbi:MAG TPA: hypothetical protein PKH97_03250 [Tetrasphaera sp.]|uniref:hypothetical protein n=1 Tax=Nostocoides sp. TaxID=1917966 RepID=UPI002CD47625|nr:hypothetical protein [Tetrasphaera sp.]HNQ06184.1 hypothetical protein [Tetrasphaera sp.]